MNHTSNPFSTITTLNYPIINEDNSTLELTIDHIVPSNLETALLSTNLFQETSDLFSLGFDHLDECSILKEVQSNHSQLNQNQHDESLASPWWTIPPITSPIGNQAQLSVNDTCSLFPMHFNSESNQAQTESKSKVNEPIKTLSGPDILDPTLNDHLPLQLTCPNTCNLIESWIDFTGGGSGSTNNVGPQSPIQLAEPIQQTDPSILPVPPLTIDDHSSNLSSTPRPPTPVAEHRGGKSKPKKTSKRRISSVSTISSSSTTSVSSASSSTSTLSSSSSSSFSPSSISSGARDQTDANPRKTKTNKRNEFLERNRLAASRSRAKKKSYQRHLEEESQRLESEQIKLNQIIQDLIIEKEHLKALVNQKFNLTPSHPLESNSDLSTNLPNLSSSSSF